jgi:predicted CoA-binding protein
MRKTLVLGATTNPKRYSYKAVRLLVRKEIPVIAVGFRKGMIENIEIETGKPDVHDIHTIALYLGKERQLDYYDYLLQLKPNRIIFNPGTDNPAFMELAKKQGIEVVSGCLLVMLHSGKF